MLLLTFRNTVFDYPDVTEMTIIYDYSQAEMFPRFGGDGFEWYNVFMNKYFKYKTPLKFIKFDAIINSSFLTFENFVETLNRNNEKNQFRNHG